MLAKNSLCISKNPLSLPTPPPPIPAITFLRDGPLENVLGDGRITKKYSRKGKLNEKKFLHVN